MNEFGFRLAGWTSSAGASLLAPLAVKAAYTHISGYSPADQSNWVGFPYTALRNYEASQIAAGKPRIFITATYQGRRRPVMFGWSLQVRDGKPTAPSSEWQYAVNVGDERFVRFWIDKYMRAVLWQRLYPVQNMWFGLDQSSFEYSNYGVIDNEGRYVSAVRWDSPFPQNDEEYLNSVASFFNYVHELAPDLRLLPNVGAISDPGKFKEIFANIPGLVHENMYDGTDPSAYTRDGRASQYANFAWFASLGRVMNLRFMVPGGNTGVLRTAFAIYSLLKSPNSFFDPQNASTGQAIPPSAYSEMQALLGNPVGSLTIVAQSGKPSGYNLYSRRYDGGIVYLNYTGETKTIRLPGTYYNAAGERVSEITMSDATGTYVSTATNKMSRPQINPRFAGPVSSKVLVSITDTTPYAIIHYTENGSTPTTGSPTYAGPFEVTSSRTVKAAAFLSGHSGSAVATASFTIVPELPIVQFAVASDAGLSGAANPVLRLSAVPSETVSVRYYVHYSNGKSAEGTVSFAGKDVLRYFSVPTSGGSGSSLTVTLTGAGGAEVGESRTYHYTIQ